MSQTDPNEPPLRPHVYDEIQEFDKQLPRWWLWTLYGSVVFAFCYWMFNQWRATTDPIFERLDRQMAQVALAKANSPDASLSDDQLWQMSRNPDIVAAGRVTFSTTCASCHGDDLKGRIGPSLLDDEWLHGGSPNEMVHTIRDGVLEKGMPSWGPVLGNTRVAEVAAFVLSYHRKPEGE